MEKQKEIMRVATAINGFGQLVDELAFSQGDGPFNRTLSVPMGVVVGVAEFLKWAGNELTDLASDSGQDNSNPAPTTGGN